MHYRFQAGDTTERRLSDGRAVPFRELRIIPWRRAPNLIMGFFRLDAETHAWCSVFKLACGFDADHDGGGVRVADREPDTAGNRSAGRSTSRISRFCARCAPATRLCTGLHGAAAPT
jgi:hypothetical protein